MTPLEIEILFHYHCVTTDFPRLEAPAVKKAIEMFVAKGILHVGVEFEGEKSNKYIANRDATNVYVEALCSVPLPLQVWEIPTEAQHG